MISETIVVVLFLSGFPPFDVFKKELQYSKDMKCMWKGIETLQTLSHSAFENR
jgi:hypothetical protein